jgi:hypothetical protein
MKTITIGLKGLVLAAGCLALLSCNPIENKTKSSTMLIIENMTGLAQDGTKANYLESDVMNVDASGNASVTEDPAIVTFSAKLLDPASTLGPSQYNDIIVTRYVVRYIRADGRNREGVDVPYSFEGAMSTQVKVDSSTDVTFVIVRGAAKLEPPLLNLDYGQGEGEIQVTAQVDFYGHDLMNNNVHVTGYMAIFFADFADR